MSSVDCGWDNAVFRLGTDLGVRLPRRELAAGIIRNEQRWLPTLAPKLPIPIPVPLRTSEPGFGYAWFWSIVPWFEGTTADTTPLHPDETSRYAAFLRALHFPAPAEAPRNPWRGVPLRDRAEVVEKFGDATISRIFQIALEAKEHDPPTWIHGDLHPRNVLVRNGKLAAIIDWGDVCSGDPATDLASVWMLFPEERAREHVLKECGADRDTIDRARGWAALLAIVFLTSGDERQARIGEATLSELATHSRP